MKIGFDISPLSSGHAHRGTGTYTSNLFDGLKKNYQIEVIPFTNKESFPSNVDLIHVPYFDPFFLTLRISSFIPTIVTIHDLIPLVFPEHFFPGLRGKVKWAIQKNRVKAATAIITDSNASKKDIQNILNKPETDVFPIHLAPSSSFTAVSDILQKDVVAKYKLPNRFLLYVGDVNWNKNIETMIRASMNTPFPLVLVGKAFQRKDIPEVKKIYEFIRQHSFQHRIHIVGYVSDQELSALYTAALCTVFISYAEGFGLPVLESMACGTPCVTSNVSSLIEIAGPSILVDPYSSESVTEGILRCIGTPKSAWSSKLSEWVCNFSWEKTVEETIKVYQHVVSS